MPDPAWYDDLLRALTLGTARGSLPAAVVDWLEEREATDPTATAPEHLLAAFALTERMHRLRPRPLPLPPVAPAPAEDYPYASGQLGRALRLVLTADDPGLLPEAVACLRRRKLLLPPQLLPDLLAVAQRSLATGPAAATELMAVGGKRAGWLAEQHPAWRELTPAFDVAAAWAKDATPGRRAVLLRQLRRRDPAAARALLASVWADQSPKNQESLLEPMRINPGPEDVAWLRARLGPKRRGVRRAILRLLLLAGDERAHAELLEIAAGALTNDGKFRTVLDDPELTALLQQYGGLNKKEDFGQFLLSLLPPGTLAELTDRSPEAWWNDLTKAQLTAAAEAMLTYPPTPLRAEFVAYGLHANPTRLPVGALAELTAALPQATFVDLFHDLLTREKNVLHHGGLPRVLLLSRREPWSDRLTKAFVLQLVATLRDLDRLPYGLRNDLQQQFRLAIPLLSPTTFGWVRTHLHSLTERSDVFGKLATETLQTLNFRRVFYHDE